jgi:hypothetical protein
LRPSSECLDLFVGDDLSNRRIACFDERRRPYDGHGFRELAKLQRNRYHRVAVDLQHDAGLYEVAEPG